MLLGLWWTWNTVVSPFRKISTEGFDTSNIIFLLTIVPLMAIPGVIAIIFGARLFREFGEPFLKWVIGVFAVFLAFFLAFKISAFFPLMIHERLQESVMLFLASIISIIAYLFVVRLLLRYFIQENRNSISLLSRGVLVLMAWQLWLLLSKIFDVYSPIKEGYNHTHDGTWIFLRLLVPILVAYGSYRAVATILTK